MESLALYPISINWIILWTICFPCSAGKQKSVPHVTDVVVIDMINYYGNKYQNYNI